VIFAFSFLFADGSFYFYARARDDAKVYSLVTNRLY